MKTKFALITLFILSLLPLVVFLHSGLPITHDGKDHVARIANFYLNLSQGNLIPVWAGNLNWGYGHPVLEFLYPLPSYIGSLFRVTGFSFINSTKLVFAVSYILSGMAMYFWLSAFLKKEAALLGSLLYLFAPYRFVDLFVRGAIGEHVAFIFPPLICYFLYRLLKKTDFVTICLGSLSVAGLILSHNAISIMFMPFCFLYGVYLLLTTKKKKMFAIHGLSLFVFGFLLAAFFWIPAFFEGKYTLRDIVSTKDYARRLYPLAKFMYSPWSFGGTGEFSLQIGIFQWLAVIAGIVAAALSIRNRKRLGYLSLLLLVFFSGSLFLMIPPSVFIWDHISLLQKFQFPWRFLSVSVFTAAALGAVSIEILSLKWLKGVVIAGVVGIVLVTVPYWKAQGYLNLPDSFFSLPYAGTTDTGESSPIWSTRFMEHFPPSTAQVIDGAATIHLQEHLMTHHVYQIHASQPSMVLENTLYFPDWEVFVDNTKTQIEFQNPQYRGLMLFHVPQGDHTVSVIFHQTRLRQLALFVSAFGLLCLLLSAILRKRLWQN